MDEVHECPRDGDRDGEVAVGKPIEGDWVQVGIKQITLLQSLDSAPAADDTVEGCC